jgi:hypothetical protein
MSAAGALTSWAAAVLRAEDAAISRLSHEPSSAFLQAADAQGVLYLIDRVLRQSPRFDEVPRDFREELVARVRCEQSVELARRTELTHALESLRSAGVSALLFKGAALAYTHYSSPHLRPRCDSDLLIADRDRGRVLEVLERIGYEHINAVNSDAIFTQWMFCKPGVGRVEHVLDVHWRIANRPLFRDLLFFDELDASAVEISALGPGARTPAPVHSMLIACIHPVAHHRCDWQLIWLYDLLLLGQRLDRAEWPRFRELAADRKVSFICKETFELVSRYFGESAWLHDSGMLAIPSERRFEEPSAAYLDPQATARQDLLLDLKAIEDLTGKARLLMAHAFPDKQYMRAAYDTSGWLGITSAYTRRIVGACVQLARAAR